MSDGFMCPNVDCIRGWRPRKRGDAWWDEYLGYDPAVGDSIGQRLEKAPEKAPPKAYGSTGRTKTEWEDDDATPQGGWVSLDEDESALESTEGFHPERAGTKGTPDGRPVEGITDMAELEAELWDRLDGSFEQALQTCKPGRTPDALSDVRRRMNVVVVDMVTRPAKQANVEALAEVIGCTPRLIQKIVAESRGVE